ncbi:hypothetical protein T439DRAFT_330589 [Meredithblackwellia eburnea MCA 4105]
MLNLVRRPLVQTLHRASRSYATKVADSIPKAAPHDGIKYSAKPEDSTVGELGQVFLPDTYVPPVYRSAIIPSEPDNYQLSASESTLTSSSEAAPKVHTVASPTTHHGGGPSHGSSGGGDDVILGEHGDSTASLPKHADVSVKNIPFEFVERDLNTEEQTGLIALAIILVGGILIGKLGAPKVAKKEGEDKKEEKH